MSLPWWIGKESPLYWIFPTGEVGITPVVADLGKKLAIGGLIGLVGLGVATYTVARVQRLAQD